MPASGTTVKNQASHTTPPIQSNETNRSVALYNNVINQFAVQYNPRYTQVYVNGTLTKTYCNIFVWDVTSAMGAPIPHWVDAKGLPAADYQVVTSRGCPHACDFCYKSSFWGPTYYEPRPIPEIERELRPC